jgi:hypothetical protein
MIFLIFDKLIHRDILLILTIQIDYSFDELMFNHFNIKLNEDIFTSFK